MAGVKPELGGASLLYREIRETAASVLPTGGGVLSAAETPNRLIQHEACYQNEPHIDKWPCQAVQKFFKKVKKKLVTP